MGKITTTRAFKSKYCFNHRIYGMLWRKRLKKLKYKDEVSDDEVKQLNVKKKKDKNALYLIYQVVDEAIRKNLLDKIIKRSMGHAL